MNAKKIAEFREREAASKAKHVEILRTVLPDLKDEQVTRVTSAYRTENILMTLLQSPAERKVADEARARLCEVFFKSTSVLKKFIKVAQRMGLRVKGFHPIKKRGLDWVRTKHPVSAVVDFGSVKKYADSGRVAS